MLIPIIHTKSTLQPKIILFLVLTGLILVVLILLSSSGMLIKHQKTLNLVLVLTLASQFIFALYFLLTKSYENVGRILIEENSFSVKIGKELNVYSISKMVDTRLFFNHYKSKKRKGILGMHKFKTGNYIIFQYAGKTRIYELLFKSRTQMDELLNSVKKYLPADKYRVFED